MRAMLEYSERTLYGKVVDVEVDRIREGCLGNPTESHDFSWAAWIKESRADHPSGSSEPYPSTPKTNLTYDDRVAWREKKDREEMEGLG